MTSIGTSVTRALLAVALSSALAACGNKGPLVLPPPAEPAPDAPQAPTDALAPEPKDAAPEAADGDDVLRVDGDATVGDEDAGAKPETPPAPPPPNG